MKLRALPKNGAGRLALAVLVAVSGLTLCGCSGDDDDDDQGAKAGELDPCNAGALEADLDAQPLTGPGVDPATGALVPPPEGTSYVVSSTYGAPKPDEAVLARWGQLFGSIEAALKTQPGLVAMQVGASTSCGSGRTLSVWASEEAMYDFVSGPAHLDAMNASAEVLRPGFAVTHWTASEVGQMSFAEGARRLAAKNAR